VSESRVSTSIYGRKRKDVAGGYRMLYSEELHNSYYLPNMIRVTKSTRMRWVGSCTAHGRD